VGEGEEGVVVIVVEGVVVLSTNIVRQARLTLTRKSTRVGEVMRAVLNLRQRRPERLMPKLRVPLLLMPGILCRLIPGAHPHRQIHGVLRLLKAMLHQLLRTRRAAMIANSGIETKRKKITPSPTSNISHR